MMSPNMAPTISPQISPTRPPKYGATLAGCGQTLITISDRAVTNPVPRLKEIMPSIGMLQASPTATSFCLLVIATSSIQLAPMIGADHSMSLLAKPAVTNVVEHCCNDTCQGRRRLQKQTVE